MELIGSSEKLDTSSAMDWAMLTELYVENYAMDNNFILDTSFLVTDQIVNPAATERQRGLRQLQQDVDSITLVYTQTLTYDIFYTTIEDPFTPEFLTTEPFAAAEDRAIYTQTLTTSDNQALQLVTAVTAVILPTAEPSMSPSESPAPTAATLPPSQSPTNKKENDDDGLSMGAIIGIAAGGGVGLILFLCFCWSLQSAKDGATGPNGARAPDMTPPTELKMKPSDDISALDEHNNANNGGRTGGGGTSEGNNDSVAGYGDQRYVLYIGVKETRKQGVAD
jgi:hypothetical protein